jgi:uncharacterized protein YcnI
MQNVPRGRRAIVAATATAIALVVCSGAWAHAHVSPPVAVAKEGQVFTLAVPTEKEGVKTTKIELAPPKGFSIDSFFPATGWTRSVQQTGSGDTAVVTKVTWSGGSVPTGEDAAFSFLGLTDGSGDYTFRVRQTYSDGSVVDWAGPASSDTPAPVVKAESSLGGAGGSSTLSIIALVVGGLGLVLGAVALLTRSGGRALA